MDWFLYDRDLRHEGVAQIYDPVSIFPVIYKIFEKFMFKQIASLIDIPFKISVHLQKGFECSGLPCEPICSQYTVSLPPENIRRWIGN